MANEPVMPPQMRPLRQFKDVPWKTAPQREPATPAQPMTPADLHRPLKTFADVTWPSTAPAPVPASAPTPPVQTPPAPLPAPYSAAPPSGSIAQHLANIDRILNTGN